MSESKTLRGWMDTFPEPYRTQAYENYHNDEYVLSQGRTPLDNTYNSWESAILWLFAWKKTPQGDYYWNKFQQSQHLQIQPEPLYEIY